MLFARATLRAGGPPGKISRTNGARSAVAVHTQPQAFWLAVTHPRSVARRCVLAAGHCECAQRPWGPYCPRWEMGCNSGSRYFAANSLTCAMVTGRHGLSRTAVREARKSGGPGGLPGERIGLTPLIWPNKSTHDPRRLARSICGVSDTPQDFKPLASAGIDKNLAHRATLRGRGGGHP